MKSSNHLRTTFFSREYAIGLLFVFLLSSGTSVFAAADHALPTSALYAIKLNVTEPLRTLTKTTPEARIDWAIERTSRRLEETRILIENQNLTEEIAQDISSHIQEHTESAQIEIKDLAQTNTQKSTLLSLSLVETIEKKKEEIVISNTQIKTQNAIVLSGAETAAETVSEKNAQKNPEDLVSPETLQVATGHILSISEKAQENTTAFIQTINTKIAEHTKPLEAPNTQAPTTLDTKTETESNVITYSLILKDVHDKTTLLQKALKIDPETVKANPVTEVLPEETSTTTTVAESSDATIDSRTETAPSNTTPISLTNVTSPTPPEDTETGAQKNRPLEIKITPTNTSLPEIVAEASKKTTIEVPKEDTTGIVTSLESTSKNSISTEPVKPAAEKIKTFKERYEEISIQFKELQTIVQPTREDITKARELRKLSEQLLNEIARNKNLEEKISVSNTDIVLPPISTETISIPTEKITKEPTAALPSSIEVVDTTLKPAPISELSPKSAEITLDAAPKP